MTAGVMDHVWWLENVAKLAYRETCNMPTKLVDVFDADGKLLHSYPITLGGALTDDDYIREAQRAAQEDRLVTKDQLPKLKFKIRSPN